MAFLRMLGRAVFVAAALLPLLASHAALATGRGMGVALGLAVVQALALGVMLWRALGKRLRFLGPGASLLLLGGLGWGAAYSPAAGLMAMAGLGHALLYGGLLALFGSSLRPGRVSLVTRLAQRFNPHFHAGMVPYTRKVTAAWAVFALAQLLLSAGLVVAAPGAWWLLVGSLHGPMAAGLALGELAVRSWRFRHQGRAGLRATLAAMRLSALRSDGTAGAGASRPAADCPGRSGNARHRPGPA